MNAVVCRNIGADLGDCASVQAAEELKYGKRVEIVPIQKTLAGCEGNIVEAVVTPYFHRSMRHIGRFISAIFFRCNLVST